MTEHAEVRGLAGRLAAAFIDSKLTPLLILVSLLLGIGATLILPREEEPQIIVPMADVMISMPGATAQEVEQQVTSPMEKLVKEIEGVEYVYSITRPGQSMLIVRFLVGQNPDAALVRLYNKLYSNQDRVPPGVSWPPLVKPRSIDNVPILALTLHGGGLGGYELRQVAAQLEEQIKQVADVSETELIGGDRRQLRVELMPAQLAAYNLTPRQIVGALATANAASRSGRFDASNRSIEVRTGEFLTNAEAVRNLVVAADGQRPVYLRDVATVIDGAAEPTTYVSFTPREGTADQPAVTISIAKRRGSNAIVVAENVLHKVEAIRENYLPAGVEYTVTRNYGETAAERSNELLWHMGIAVFSVVALMWIALGRRESAVVAVAIPVTLALTVCTFVLYGFTLNRVTFFALIFSIGILVDDAIVVVENIVRHMRMPENHDRKTLSVVLEAVDEVGNPTILATLTVMAAILPMAFVSGLMGPYMLPIPLGASAAMAFSMLVAFTIIPWAAIRMLRRDGEHHEEKEDGLTRLYRRLMRPLIVSPMWRTFFLVGIVGLLMGSLAMVPLRIVLFKMLPFDNKSEFQILVNMPEGSTLEQTSAVTRELGAYLRTVPEVIDYETYVGTSSPYNFNGLVRHYFTRSGPNMADLQVNLLPKEHRKRSSHEISRSVRPFVTEIARKYGARLQVAEIPPGPPVLQTLVTEVYGPQRAGQIELAEKVRGLYEQAPDVVDVDWYMERPQPELRLRVDREKAALSGIAVEDVTSALETALSGQVAGLLHDPTAREPVEMLVRFGLAARNPSGLDAMQINGRSGRVKLTSLLKSHEDETERSIYHKNLQPVVYVIGDVAGKADSPLYSILDVQKGVGDLNGGKVATWWVHQPTTTEGWAIKWDGEWQVTYEVFRDMGIAFAVVLVLIYALIVGWFQNFLTPLVIVSAIPFSLVGIMPGHWLAHAFFSATSMIGFIAGAGIVVRNSIILVDFIELRLSQGMPLEEAVIDAGAVRFRPMMLTAAAVVAGSVVMLADPIFQGLAISLVAGEVASLLLSRSAVPVLYYMLWKQTHPPASAPATTASALPVLLGAALLALLATMPAGAQTPTPSPAAAATASPSPATTSSPSPTTTATPSPATAATPSATPGPSPSATAPSPAPLRLTLDEAVQRAIASSPALDASKWQITEAWQRREEAKAPGRTQVGFEGGYTYLTPTLNFGPYPLQVNNNYSVGVMVRQALLTFGRLEWREKAAALQALGAKAEAEQKRQDLQLEVRQAYAQVLLAQEAVRIEEDRLAADRGQLEVARTRVEAGAAPKFDVISVDASVAEGERRLIVARNDVAVAMARLATALGLPPEQTFDLQPVDFTPSVNPAEPVEQVVARSPRLDVARKAVEAGRARVEAAKADNRPSVDVQAGYARRNDTAFQTADLFQAGLQLRIPLADGGLTKARVAQAEAVVHQLEDQLEGARRSLLLDLREASLAVQVSRQSLAAAEASHERASEQLRVARVRFKGGVSVPLEITEAQAALTRADVARVQARYAVRLAEWRYLHAVGLDAPKP